ncbi:MAG: two-component system sensor histidine kinase NtrB [Desulfobulbus sp.]|jgi:two-component system sensor histidine kinase PilS (NtrC family)
MPRFLRRFLAPVTDDEQAIRQHLLWWLALRVILFTALAGITALLQSKGQPVITPPTSIQIVALAAISLFSIASGLLLRRLQIPVRPFATLQLLCDIAFHALLVYATGCSQSNLTALLILPVIAGGLILYRRGALFLAAVATLLYGGVLCIEQLGWTPGYFPYSAYTPPDSELTGINLFAIYGLLLFVAALISGQLARRLRVTEERLSRTTVAYDRLATLYKQIFDDISTGIITIDPDDRITSYNRAAERITGYPVGQMLGRPFDQFFAAMSAQQGQGRMVCDFVRSTGEQIRIGYGFSRLNMPEPVPPDGGQGKWKVVTLQDISLIERMEQQVREAEKMAAIGELSAKVAHDFRNPLAAISGSAELLNLGRSPAALDPATSGKLLDIILRESRRMAKTITDFLQFARPAEIQPEWFDLNRLLDETLLQCSSGDGTQQGPAIVRHIPEPFDCWGDRQQLQTVLAHLLDNARHAATTADTTIRITAREETTETQEAMVCLEVHDQGPGIPAELRDEVFTPFFSTRTDASGLGLAIVRQIVERHRGEATLVETGGKGCCLRIRLPLPRLVATP